MDERALVLTVGCLCFLNRPMHGAGKYLQVEYASSTEANQLQIGVTYIMWVPNDVARFRCVIVHQYGAGRNAAENGFTAAYDLHWQTLAKKWDCALLGPSYHVSQGTPFSFDGDELESEGTGLRLHASFGSKSIFGFELRKNAFLVRFAADHKMIENARELVGRRDNGFWRFQFSTS